MCCYHSEDLTKRFLLKHKNHKTVTVYKIYKLVSDGLGGLNPYICTPYQYAMVNPGMMISNNKKKDRYHRNHQEINRGIHTFLKRQDAESYCMQNGNRIVVPVKVNMSDLLSVGGFDRFVDDWTDSGITLVFRKINLSQKTYDFMLQHFNIKD